MNKVFFTSDLHLNHNKDFIWGARGFKSVHEMNYAILDNFSKIVDWDDDLYILGDVLLGDNEVGIDYLSFIPGKKHIILGNHDTDTRRKIYENRVYKTDVIGYADVFKYGKRRFYLSHYPTMTGNYDDKDKLATWNLSGHTHSKDKFQYFPQNIYNVAVDAHDCKPVEIEQIIEDIKEKR